MSIVEQEQVEQEQVEVELGTESFSRADAESWVPERLKGLEQIELRRKVKASATSAGAHQAKFVRTATTTGFYLLALKWRMKEHAEKEKRTETPAALWATYLEENFVGSKKTAERYMRMAQDVIDELPNSSAVSYLKRTRKVRTDAGKSRGASRTTPSGATIAAVPDPDESEVQPVAHAAEDAPDAALHMPGADPAPIPQDHSVDGAEERAHEPAGDLSDNESLVCDIWEKRRELAPARSTLIDSSDRLRREGRTEAADEVDEAAAAVERAVKQLDSALAAICALIPADRLAELVGNGFDEFAEV